MAEAPLADLNLTYAFQAYIKRTESLMGSQADMMQWLDPNLQKSQEAAVDRHHPVAHVGRV